MPRSKPAAPSALQISASVPQSPGPAVARPSSSAPGRSGTTSGRVLMRVCAFINFLDQSAT